MIRDAELPLFTFGWELEASGRARRPLVDIQVGHDGSVDGDGLEYRTRREAVFDPERSLSALRTLTMDPGLVVNRSCGFHVHLGLGTKTRKLHTWAANFVTLARLVEVEAFQAVPESRRSNSFCRSWASYRGSVIAPRYSGSKHNNETRYCWINPVEIFRPGGIRTIEIRLMGDTKNYLYLLAWTSFCRRMAASSWALIHDPSRLEEEVRELKGILKTIRQCFITREITGVTKAQAVVMLAGRAGFYEALIPSLAPLRAKEDKVLREVYTDIREREEYARQIARMREYQARAKDSLDATHPGQMLPGTVVVALVEDPEGYTVPGQEYTVLVDNPDNFQVQIRRGPGGWWIPRDTVRLRDSVAVTA